MVFTIQERHLRIIFDSPMKSLP